jgi:hypothetical protein
LGVRSWLSPATLHRHLPAGLPSAACLCFASFRSLACLCVFSIAFASFGSLACFFSLFSVPLFPFVASPASAGRLVLLFWQIAVSVFWPCGCCQWTFFGLYGPSTGCCFVSRV